ncbi:MAG: ATP synthase subunit I [Oscillospiraceae bacterium]|nr:ATP synthase subunit I [Oscillospiraceae bacterium]
MKNADLLNEVRYICIRSLLIDVAAVFIASFFVSVGTATVSILTGTLLLAVEMILLAISVNSAAANAKDGKNGSVMMAVQYIIRIIIIASVLYVSLKVSYLNIICTALPLFYPKIIYFGRSFLTKKEG